MSPARISLARFALIPAMALFSYTTRAQALPAAPPTVQASSTCTDLPHSDHPMARLSNGAINAVVFLPDKNTGYYRGPRFDWSGVVGCLSLNGHTFFGEWFNKYDPTGNDAITGPVEEFRHPTSEIGYDDAVPGGMFVKIGVGVLKRIDDKPYKFGNAYPILDTGKWKTKVHKNSVTFQQELHSSIGVSYIYEKVLTLDKHGNVLRLEHRLKNVGTKPIDTQVYDHDFFMLDHKQTGPSMQVRFPFTPVLDSPVDPTKAVIEDNAIKFIAPLERRGVQGYLTGYSTKVSDYDFTFEDKDLGIGVQQTSDSPINLSYFWSTPKTVCPEAYIKIHVAPGGTQTWMINYRFFTK